VRWRLVQVAAAAAALSFPAGAEAAVDFGSNLNATPGVAVDCPDGCTMWNRSIVSADKLAGDAAPSSGVIVRFTVKHSSNGGGLFEPPIHLRAIHQSSPGVWQGLAAGSPDVRLSNTAGTETFTTRVPIAAGDLIGIEAVGEPFGAVFALAVVPGGGYSISEPALTSTPSPATFSDSNHEVLLQARLEPDADGDGFGDETQDGCSTSAQSQTVCPPPPATKKKCKKKKKAKKRAAEAKKKKCRNKKRH
jgi:hypothetical protein